MLQVDNTELELIAPSPAKRRAVLNGRVVFISMASIVNGALYFTIAVEGGGNIRKLFGVNENSVNTLIFSVGVGASLVYTMFTYKTFESLSLRINTLPKGILSLLAPFSAAAFLTAGKEGAELLHFNEKFALAIGITLFLLRTINCVDASVKFPNRLFETKKAWNEACITHDYRELARLIFIWISSIGYVACTTDAIYNTSEIIFGWFNITNSNLIQPISYTASILGALGTLPLNVYWSYRGLRQLTFGGKVNASGDNPDPTDRYTYIGLLLVIPVMLGILGGATSATGAVFGRLGTFSQIIRVVSSILYAAFAGTPGMATLLRNTCNYLQTLSCFANKVNERTPLLSQSGNIAESKNQNTGERKSFLNNFSFFKCSIKHNNNQQNEPISSRILDI